MKKRKAETPCWSNGLQITMKIEISPWLFFESQFIYYFVTVKKEKNIDREWLGDDQLDPKNIIELIESFDLNNPHEQDDEIRKLLGLVEKTSHVIQSFFEKFDASDGMNDIDEFTEEERHFTCEKAIKTVLGGNAKFTDGSTGPTQLYRIYKDQKDQYLIGRGKFQIDEVVKAFSCPTQPVVYLALAMTFSENIVQVIVSGRDLALSLLQFK